MKTASNVSKIHFIFLLSLLSMLTPGKSMAVDPSGSGVAPIGIGSIPGRLFPDGTVCITDSKDSSRCEKILFKLPDEIVKKEKISFHGIFDVDNDGDPEVFLGYRDSDDPICLNRDFVYRPEQLRYFAICYDVNLLVYKKVETTYHTYLKLKAWSTDYDSGAWFLDELPVRKAIFGARAGSSGSLLYYLDLKKQSLEEITHRTFLQGAPIFEDLDKDGIAEIFIEGRGRDRTGEGAELLHWKDDTYKIWWPDWTAPPSVIYADMVDLDNDQQKEIIAVLDTEGYGYSGRRASNLRELGVWKLTKGGFALVDKVKLPETERWGAPTILKILPTSHGAEIYLDYPEKETLKCTYLNEKITCSETEKIR